MTRIYVAGPMTGYPRWNFDAFAEATEKLRAAGYEVVSPAENDLALGFDPDAPVEDFTEDDYTEALQRDLEIIQTVDAIALLPGWHRSRGANVEVRLAKMLGLPVSTVGLFQKLAAQGKTPERTTAI